MLSRRIILASSSPYRREILKKAGFDIEWHAPSIDETPRDGEPARDLVQRLSRQKAEALSHHGDSLVIGSDQVAECGDEIFGKPANRAEAVRQLTRASGSIVLLHTGLALLNTRAGRCQMVHELCEIVYRPLSRQIIESYVDRESPYDSCGSVRIEGPGITLLKRVKSGDPNTLMGLPLLRLVDLLESEGIEIG